MSIVESDENTPARARATGLIELQIGADAGMPVPAPVASITPTPLASAGTASFGSIAVSGEQDWYSVSLTAGVTYTFSLQGSATARGSLADPYLGLYTAGGALLSSNDSDGIGTNALIRFTPSTSGSYLLAASGVGTTTGTYQLMSLPNDASPSSSPAPLTGISVVDATTHGYSWVLGPTRTITWSLADSGAWHWTDPQASADRIQEIFESVEAFANVKFEYAGYYSGTLGLLRAGSSGVDISIAFDSTFFSSTSVWGRSYFPSTTAPFNPYAGAAGDIILNPNSEANDLSFLPGSAGYYLILHELGHSLGLKHPHDDGGTGHPTFEQAGLSSELDIDWATVMSYNDELSWNLTSFDPSTPMVLDVIALQSLYGANTSINAGDSNHLLFVDDRYQTIWDPSGTDTVDASLSAFGWSIVLPEDASGIGLAERADESLLFQPTTLYWLMGSYENVNGSAQDDGIYGSLSNNILFGNAGSDLIEGDAGDDTIDGGTGADWMDGGTGNDLFVVDNAGDVVIEAAGQGTDTVQASISYFLPDAVENLTLAAGAGNLTGGGNALDNVLTGNSGNNILLGAAGNDVLIGGAGNDILAGGAGNDTLDGGSGANEMIGSTGNDLYVVTATSTLDAAQQTLYEAAGEGIDEVQVTASVFSLEWYGSSELEYLTITDSGSHAAIIGNALNNRITGGTGADALFGRAGNDVLIGGSGIANTLIGNEGDDTYIVSAVGDSIIEFAGQGLDTVMTSLSSFTMRSHVENLVYTGTSAFTGIGSADDNRITGGSGADFLSGLDGADVLVGGSGADTLLGGAGADQFRFSPTDTGTDRILDFSSGSDLVVLAGFTHTAFFTLVQTSGAPLPVNTNCTVLYDRSTGILSYDADGTGSGAAVNVAQLNVGLTLSVADFLFDTLAGASDVPVDGRAVIASMAQDAQDGQGVDGLADVQTAAAGASVGSGGDALLPSSPWLQAFLSCVRESGTLLFEGLSDETSATAFQGTGADDALVMLPRGAGEAPEPSIVDAGTWSGNLPGQVDGVARIDLIGTLPFAAVDLQPWHEFW